MLPVTEEIRDFDFYICCLWLLLSNEKSYCDKELIYRL